MSNPTTKRVARYFWDSLRAEWALAVFLTIATSSAYIRAANATTATSVILYASTCLVGVVASAVTWRSAVRNEINRLVPETTKQDTETVFDPAYTYSDRHGDVWHYEEEEWWCYQQGDRTFRATGTPPAEYGPYTRIEE